MKCNILNDIEKGSKNSLIKRRIITHYIHNLNSTITDLSSVLELSVPTVTKFVDEMCESGYLNTYGKLETTGGRHPSLYGLNPESGYFVGVEMKRKALNIGLINFNGDMVKKSMDLPYKFENTPSGMDSMCNAITEFIDDSGVEKEKILNIHINVPGRVNSCHGYSYSTFNFSEEPLSDVIAEKTGYRVSIDNDTRAMTYGEFLRGNVKNERNVLFINMSWGTGLGIIINGKIYTGKSGFAGEFGHIPVFDNEVICQCGKKGCLETEVSGQALLRTLRQRVAAGENSIISAKVMTEPEALTLADVIAAVNMEDTLCIDIVERIGYLLGKQIAGLINIFNPERVIVGGTLSLTGDYILQPVKTAIRKHSLNMVSNDSLITISALKDNAGIVGSCMLARSRVFED